MEHLLGDVNYKKFKVTDLLETTKIVKHGVRKVVWNESRLKSKLSYGPPYA